MIYLFGDFSNYNYHSLVIEADTVEFAIYKFAYTAKDLYAYINDTMFPTEEQSVMAGKR